MYKRLILIYYLSKIKFIHLFSLPLSVSMSLSVSVFLSVSAYLSVCLSDCLSDCLSVSLSFFLSFSVSLSLCLCLCLSVCVSLSFPPSSLTADQTALFCPRCQSVCLCLSVCWLYMLKVCIIQKCVTEWCMQCMHVCVWRCERTGFVWMFLCFMYTFSLSHRCFIYIYI